ncbi:MAG: hypothetical protein IPN07_14210 [Dehalococcoidia bacterium]|nr:hypothetical protein [Dehalococcoidia bacterium]
MGEKETASAEEAGALKQKTKSNQSNDRTAAGDGGDLDDDAGELERQAAPKKAETKDAQRVAGGGSGDPAASAINNSHSNIKNLRDSGGGGGIAIDEEGVQRVAAGGPGDPAASAINNTKSNIKNLQDIDGGRGIAIDEEGAQGIAVGDEGTPADKSNPKTH